MLYFAYGSNLNLSQMARRCPAATPLDKLMLPGWQLVFRSVADIVQKDGAECPGGVWRITPKCEAALDRYEGFDPQHPDRGMYRKVVIELDGMPEGETQLMFYVMNSTGIYPPSEGYYDCIVQGYKDFGLKRLPLKIALKHSHDCKKPSHVERKRLRRNGRPPAQPRPVSKKGNAGAKRASDPTVFHDPWANVPMVNDANAYRRKTRNLTDWLNEKKGGGDRY